MNLISEQRLLDFLDSIGKSDCGNNWDSAYARAEIIEIIRDKVQSGSLSATPPGDILRCLVTNNPCGTDTWAKDQSCGCGNCQRWLNTRAQGGWLPIETAPKDGSAVLVSNLVMTGEARYFPDDDGWWWANTHPTDAFDGKVWNPSHWQPLPSPPTSQNERGGS